jgi:hypothetical protein
MTLTTHAVSIACLTLKVSADFIHDLTVVMSIDVTNYRPNTPDRFNNQKMSADIPTIRPIDQTNP